MTHPSNLTLGNMHHTLMINLLYDYTFIKVGEFYSMAVVTLGNRIENARIAKGYNLTQLARRLAIKSSTLKNWECNNSEPRANKLNMLAGILGVTLYWLMTGENDNGENDNEEHLLGTASLMQKLETAQAMSQKLNAILYDMEGDIARLQRQIDVEI